MSYFDLSSYKKFFPQQDKAYTVGLMLLMIITGFIFLVKLHNWKMPDTESNQAKIIKNVLFIMALLLVILPILIFLLGAFNLYPILNFIQPYESIVKVQYFVAIYALVFMSLLFYLRFIIKNPNDIDIWIWVASSILLVGSIFFIFLRILADRQRSTLTNRINRRINQFGSTLYDIGAGVGSISYNIGAGVGSVIYDTLPKVGSALGNTLYNVGEGVYNVGKDLYNTPDILGKVLI